MSETQGEQEDNTQAEVQQVATGEDEVQSKETEEAVSSSPDEKGSGEKPVESEGDNEGKSQTNDKPEASPKEEEAAAKPVAKQPRKLRCFDPTDTVDIAIGQSGVESTKPVTVPQFFQRTFDKIPNSPALCWKDNKEDPWQNLTYAQYKKLIYDVAKSFLKVMH